MTDKKPLPFRREDMTTDEIAADWFGRHDAGLSEAENRELQAWLQADPRHASSFQRLAAASRALDQLAGSNAGASASLDPDLAMLPIQRTAKNRKHQARWVAVTLAAAAALTLVGVTSWQILSTRPSYTTTASAEIGGLREISLPDGSVIELNTNSAVEIRYNRRDRQVALTRGEAHFKVAKDAARPFTVVVNDVAVRAVGTAFNIRVRPNDVDVLVTEGRVRLNRTGDGGSLLPPQPTATEPPVLGAGHRAVIPTDGVEKGRGTRTAVVTSVADVAISRELAWQQKRLEFGPTPLAMIVAEFNRYNQHQLVLADAELASLSVGGSFEAGGYDTLVRLLESSFGIVAEHRDHQTILRRR